MRTGDFSEFLGAPNEFNQVHSLVAVHPALQHHQWPHAATPYVNDQLPVINPVAQYLFAHPEFYPLPNRPSSNANSPDTNNYQGYNKSAYVNNQGDIRVDYVISPKDNLWARYTHGGSFDEPIVPS